jgi:hypothetical protein
MNIHSIASNLKKAAEPILFQPLKCGVMKIIGDIYFLGDYGLPLSSRDLFSRFAYLWFWTAPAEGKAVRLPFN